jgi:hypothetical protein
MWNVKCEMLRTVVTTQSSNTSQLSSLNPISFPTSITNDSMNGSGQIKRENVCVCWLLSFDLHIFLFSIINSFSSHFLLYICLCVYIKYTETLHTHTNDITNTHTYIHFRYWHTYTHTQIQKHKVQHHLKHYQQIQMKLEVNWVCDWFVSLFSCLFVCLFVRSV